MASNEIEPQHHADPVLDPENQHHHPHHHHTNFAEQGREDEVVYSNESSIEKAEKGIPEPTTLDHSNNSQSEKDEEFAETQPAARPWYRRAMKHWRHVAHAVIWLLFTG